MKLSLISLAVLAGFVSATPTKRDLATDALRLHNTNRARYGARALTYDKKLAAGAAAYAGQCRWGHTISGSYGENLFAVGSNGGTIQAAVQAWMNEASHYDYNHPGFSLAAGHFTQVVWNSTTAVGCGIHVCNTGSPFRTEPWTYVVCRYTPPGNVQGEFQQNVGRKQ